MPDKVDWLDKHSDATMKISSIVYEIEYLAKAFGITGNSTMSKTLMAIARDVERANKDIHDAIGESISESIKRSGESTKAVLEAALAGIMMESTNPTLKGAEQ